MGNSAFSSCLHVRVHMSGKCASVRVLQANGKEVQYAHPVLAIQVMQEHPGYFVVKSTTSAALPSSSSSNIANDGAWIARQMGGCSTPPTIMQVLEQMSYAQKKVAMLRADEELEPGSTHYLLPIQAGQPDRDRKTLFKLLRTSAKVASSFEYEGNKSENAPGAEKRLFKLRRSNSSSRNHQPPRCRDDSAPQQQQQLVHQSDSGSVVPRRRGHHQSLANLFREGQGQSCELSLHQTLNLFDCRRFVSRPRRRRRLSQAAWKPVLQCIPEVVGEFREEDDDDFSWAQSRMLHSLL